MTPFRLTHNRLTELSRRGIQITPYQPYGDIPYANPAISFEPPLVIQPQLIFDGPLSVGAFTGIFGGGRLRRTTVGRYCSIANGLQTSWDEHPIDRLTSSMAGYATNIHGWAERFGVDLDAFRQAVKPWSSLRGMTHIGHDVWIGYNVFIRSGVTIGDGAIIGAGAVVTKDVPPYAIVGGNPAKVIRYRFEDSLIERFQAARWWRFNIFDVPPDLLADPVRALSWIEAAEADGELAEYKPEPITVRAIEQMAA